MESGPFCFFFTFDGLVLRTNQTAYDRLIPEPQFPPGAGPGRSQPVALG